MIRKFVGQVALNLLAIRFAEDLIRYYRRRREGSFDPYWDDE